MERLERLDVRRLAVPLERPYQLSFGPVDHYDTIIVECTGSDGGLGFGEATLLTGYTDETIGGAWDLARALARELSDASFAAASARLAALADASPFVATAFHTALDMAGGHPALTVAATTRVPLLGLLQGDDGAELADEIARLLEAGYRTFKVKIGFDVDADLARLARIQTAVAGRAAIRVDANQGYTGPEAAAFVAAVDPDGIELFEQPCPAGDWDAHRAAATAAARTGLPLMLDESIYDLADIERAAAEGACRFLKVKLMKFTRLDRLEAAIRRIRALGMTPVLGNGVACDVSCWMEACVAARTIDNAGEMNGFLKARPMLFREPLRFEQGHIVLEPGFAPRLDPDVLAGYTQDRVVHAAGAA
jgi:L-Ala-D/L-Glu epimerase